MDISKKDWKLFRERLADWQEKYMEGLIKEYINFLNDDTKPVSEKLWGLEKRIKEDKHHPGVIMEMRKSEAIWDIVRLMRLKVITYDDLSEFSGELQQEVKRIIEMSRDAGEDGIEVRVQNGDVWLTQKAISQLFNVDRSVVTKHLSNIFKEGELDENSTCANFAQVADNGKTYKYKFYSLAAIIAVGYRIDSERAYKWLIEGDVSVKGESPH